jgi:hypothetical protein
VAVWARHGRTGRSRTCKGSWAVQVFSSVFNSLPDFALFVCMCQYQRQDSRHQDVGGNSIPSVQATKSGAELKAVPKVSKHLVAYMDVSERASSYVFISNLGFIYACILLIYTNTIQACMDLPQNSYVVHILYLHVCVYMCMYRLYVFACAIYIYIPAYICLYVPVLLVYVCICVGIYKHMYVYVYVCICMYQPVSACMAYMCMYLHVLVCI